MLTERARHDVHVVGHHTPGVQPIALATEVEQRLLDEGTGTTHERVSATAGLGGFAGSRHGDRVVIRRESGPADGSRRAREAESHEVGAAFLFQVRELSPPAEVRLASNVRTANASLGEGGAAWPPCPRIVVGHRSNLTRIRGGVSYTHLARTSVEPCRHSGAPVSAGGTPAPQRSKARFVWCGHLARACRRRGTTVSAPVPGTSGRDARTTEKQGSLCVAGHLARASSAAALR